MGRSYFTEDAKFVDAKFPKWNIDECLTMEKILNEKNYPVSCGVMRVGCDRKYHDAWQVERKDIPRLVEQLFRQRIVVEVQAEGHGKASINFIYDYSADHIIDVVSKFWKNKEDKNLNYGVLSDYDIKERADELFKEPINENDIQPASVDLHLAHDLINLDGEEFSLNDNDYLLQPGEFILGSTQEYVTIPDYLVAQVDGKSSIGRLGVDIHKTAGWIDPSFEGRITLEIKNDSDKPFRLVKGMDICQIIFMTLTSPCEKGYGHPDRNNHYQNSEKTVMSKYEYDK